MNFDQVNVILKQRRERCSHESYNQKPPFVCDKILDLIIGALTYGFKVDLILLDKYYESLFQGYCGTNYCVVRNNEKVKILLDKTFEVYPEIFNMFCDGNKQTIINMLKYPIFDTCYEKLNTKIGNLVLNDKRCLDSFLRRLTSNYTENNDTLASFIIKNINMTPTILTKLSICKSELMANYISGIIDKSNDAATDELILNACSSLPYTKQIIQSLVLKNVVIAEEFIIKVIGTCSDDSIEFILNVTNKQATKIYFKHLITSKSHIPDSIDRYATNYGKVICRLNDRYDLYSLKFEINYTKDKCMVLINHGFVPDQDDIKLSIENHVEIPEIEKFGVVFDEPFLKLLQKNQFYPEYNFKCIAPELYQLQRLTVTKNLPKIRKFLKTYKTLVPDEYCMLNASSIKNNGVTIQLLMDAGGIITQGCLDAYSKMLNDNQLSILLTGFLKNVK